MASEQTNTITTEGQPKRRRRIKYSLKELEEFLMKIVGKIPEGLGTTLKEVAANLATNKEGVGLLCVASGIALKSAGVKVVIDVFPFEIPNFIPKETGEVPVADALIFCGLAAITSGAIGAIGEIIPG